MSQCAVKWAVPAPGFGETQKFQPANGTHVCRCKMPSEHSGYHLCGKCGYPWHRSHSDDRSEADWTQDKLAGIRESSGLNAVVEVS